MNHSKSQVVRQLSPENLSLILKRIGGDPESWSIDEIGDGNVNLIFSIKGPEGRVLLKRAVPYLRCVGESWPLSMKRNYFEYMALKEHALVAKEYLPEVYAFDEGSASMVMEFLGDHIILRKGMIQGKKYPRFSDHVSSYMAKTLFYTSDLFLSAKDKKEKMKLYCENVDLCKITEDLIFTDPYRTAEQNHWTTPQLDSLVTKIQSDVALKVAITQLKEKFLTSAQALIHGDLHSGSIMVNDKETKVIDPEFAFYGPMGFDVGLLFANFMLSYFSQAGLGAHSEDRQEYEGWILDEVNQIWTKFSKQFSEYWDKDLKGDFVSPNLLASPNGREVMIQLRANYLQNLFSDSIRFAGAEMIRRILGLAHVSDLDSITDPEQRATCESRALLTARELLVNYKNYSSINDVTTMAKSKRFDRVSK